MIRTRGPGWRLVSGGWGGEAGREEERMALKHRGEAIEARAAGRMSAPDRRQQILEIAVRLFSHRGFRGTTTKEIALAAGVNEAIIFRHFSSKEELYRAIIDENASSEQLQALAREVEEAMGARDDRRVFETVAWRMLDFHEVNDSAMRVMMYSALEGHELAKMVFRTHITDMFKSLAAYIEKRIEEGAFRKTDAMTAARSFVGMVIYHAIVGKFYAEESRGLLDIDSREAASRFTDIFLASMTNRSYESGGAGAKVRARTRRS